MAARCEHMQLLLPDLLSVYRLNQVMLQSPGQSHTLDRIRMRVDGRWERISEKWISGHV